MQLLEVAMWRYIKVAVFVVVLVSIAKFFVNAKLEKRADLEIPELVAKEQASLPKMIDDNVELERVSYENKTLHYYATSKIWFERSQADAQSDEQRLRADYCKNLKM